jgi:hypothetical protein
VSRHIGSTPPAEMLTFLSRSSATSRSLPDPSWSSNDLPQMLQMRRPQVAGDVVHRLRGHQAQRLRVYLEEHQAVRLERRAPSVVISR